MPKLTVTLSSELVEVLEELASINRSSVTAELKKAIRDRRFFISKTEKGNKIVLENTSEDTRTIVDYK